MEQIIELIKNNISNSLMTTGVLFILISLYLLFGLAISILGLGIFLAIISVVLELNKINKNKRGN